MPTGYSNVSPAGLKHPIHIWPVNHKGQVIRDVNAVQAKKRLEEGRLFLRNDRYGIDSPLRIEDIPSGTNVVIHCGLNTRVKVRVN